MNTSLFVSLDFDTAAAAFRLVEQLGDEASSYKVGLQMLTEEGPEVVRRLVAMRKHVFLDLKLHEIPNSVAGAVAAAAAGKLGVTMVTVHASAGSAVLRAAVEAASAYPDLHVLALTVLTSLQDHDLPEIGLAPSVSAQVVRLAKLAIACGCQGVVASAQEAATLVKALPPGTLIVTPGIQLRSTHTNDQARATTPEQAARAGATHIVVGRAITQAADPLQAFREVAHGFA